MSTSNLYDDEEIDSFATSTSSGKTNDKNDDLGQISGFEYLIPFNNQVHSIIESCGIPKDVIEIPRIVVVGSQSAGKTSVLESLVQQSFLPRGEGITTRCPILLKLINTSSETSKGQYCEFKGRKFTNFLDVQQAITKHTNQIGTGIDKQSIELTIYSPNVVTLTVVDLPGMTKVPKVDQPDDIALQIRELVLEYITPKNSIILAVSVANDDFENSDSIQIAREVDPNGERTLAVLTKLDMAKDHAKCMQALKGLVVVVKLGIIGVINRTDADIKRNRSFKDVVEQEDKFLMQKFPSIATKNGTKYLAHQLNRLLLTWIQRCFPTLDKKLKELTTVFKGRLTEIGNLEEMSYEGKRCKMIDIIADFGNAYKAQIDGRSRKFNISVPCGGARIDYIFTVDLIDGLKELSPMVNVSDKDIIIAIRNSRQIGSKLFIPEDAFKELVKIQIGKMRRPVMYCADRVYEEMIKMIPQCVDEKAKRFPKVIQQIKLILGEMLHKNFGISNSILKQYMDIQSESAITSKSDFYELMEKSVQSLKVNDMGKLPKELLSIASEKELLKSSCDEKKGFTSKSTEETVFEALYAEEVSCDDEENSIDDCSNGLDNSNSDSAGVYGSLTTEQLQSCRAVRGLMENFFSIVLDQVLDYVPKSLLYSLVYKTIDNVHQELNTKLIVEAKIDDLMKESDRVIAERDAVSNNLQAIEEACNHFEEIQEKCVF